MKPLEVYKSYLAFKNHFTKEKYDYFKYGGRSRASEGAFNKRKDRYFFERMSRKKSDDEIKNFFIANFSQASDSNDVWIGPIIDGGEKVYKQWVEHKENLFETFKSNSEDMMNSYDYDEFFDWKKETYSELITSSDVAIIPLNRNNTPNEATKDDSRP